ncbi:hypothetical protein, partial [Thermocatellispora tengchongensis]|uniref:hypothetical protein n=1 Tax=Thermocatellispora tengchongensis TaxID=1073253 RepID=UPI0031E59083
GQAAATYTDLTWHTAQELNSAAFEVEASQDGRTFRPVGQVAAACTSSQAHRYTYRHATTQSGIRYYRLRQVDQDGTNSYSAVLSLSPGRSAARSISVTAAPNPFREEPVEATWPYDPLEGPVRLRNGRPEPRPAGRRERLAAAAAAVEDRIRQRLAHALDVAGQPPAPSGAETAQGQGWD